FWLHTVRACFARHRLVVFDVEELPTHGGSLRVFAGHAAEAGPVSERVGQLLAAEEAGGMRDPAAYRAFAAAVEEVKWGLLRFLMEARRRGQSVAAYGAAAKGDTLLNYAGIRGDLLTCVADRSPHKQGRLLPGSRLPVVSPEQLMETRPAYVLILPWNLRGEIMEQLAGILGWDGKFVLAVPRLEIV